MLIHPGLLTKSAALPVMYVQTVSGNIGNTEHKSHWILNSKEVRSLIITSLIFLVVFSWVDILATAYRDRYSSSSSSSYPVERLTTNLASAAAVTAATSTHHATLPHAPHRISPELKERTRELTLGKKFGYSLLLTTVAVVAYVLLSLPGS